MRQVTWSSVLATASAAASWLDTAAAWKLNRSQDLAIESSFKPTGAFLEAQWGEVYSDVPGVKNADGSYSFIFVSAVDGYVVGHEPPKAPAGEGSTEGAGSAAGPVEQPSGAGQEGAAGGAGQLGTAGGAASGAAGGAGQAGAAGGAGEVGAAGGAAGGEGQTGAAGGAGEAGAAGGAAGGAGQTGAAGGAGEAGAAGGAAGGEGQPGPVGGEGQIGSASGAGEMRPSDESTGGEGPSERPSHDEAAPSPSPSPAGPSASPEEGGAETAPERPGVSPGAPESAPSAGAGNAPMGDEGGVAEESVSPGGGAAEESVSPGGEESVSPGGGAAQEGSQGSTSAGESAGEEAPSGAGLPDFPLGDCILKNVSVTGPGEYAQKTNIASFEACRQMCLNDDRCKWFTYNTKTKKCYLKETYGPIKHVINDDYSSPKFCNSSCYHKNTRMVGAQISTSTTDSVYVCHFNCYTNPLCSFFSYQHLTKTCELFNAEGHPALQIARDYVSGHRNGCGDEAKPSDTLQLPQKVLEDIPVGECMKKGVSVTGPGEYTARANVATLQACHDICLNEDRCHWFTFNGKTKRCHLKANAGPIKEVLPDDVTSPKLCDASCLRKNMQVVGNLINSSDQPNVFFCRYNCGMTQQCSFFSYNPNTRMCDLFSNENAAMVVAGGYISGHRNGCGSEAKPGDNLTLPTRTLRDVDLGTCRQENVSVTGPGEYKNQSGIQTLQACNRMCLDDDRCKWYTYNTKNKICYFKANIGPIRHVIDKDITSPKYCDSSCYGMHKRIVGDLIETKDGANTVFLCHYHCVFNGDCHYFSWNSNNRQCELYRSAEARGTVPAEGFVSGPRDGCGAEAKEGGIKMVA